MSSTVLRNKPGRRPIGPAVTFRVPVSIRTWVVAEAKRTGRPAADIWRDITEAEYRRRTAGAA